MEWRVVMERIAAKALRIFLPLCLVTGLVPAVALADTAVSVSASKSSQITKEVKLDEHLGSTDVVELAEQSLSGVASAPETEGESKSEAKQNDKVEVSNLEQPSQVTAEVALAKPEGAQRETVLTDGLIYDLDKSDLTATLTGWYGTAPKGDLSLPSEVVSNGKHYILNSLGGGSFHR